MSVWTSSLIFISSPDRQDQDRDQDQDQDQGQDQEQNHDQDQDQAEDKHGTFLLLALRCGELSGPGPGLKESYQLLTP